MKLKNIQIIFYTIILNFFLIFSASAQAEKECFEKVSRGIFKFNQGFDNVILEPLKFGGLFELRLPTALA